MKVLVLIGLCAALGGCCVGDEQCDKQDAINVDRAEKRIELFRECMELAAMNTRLGDDDVSDIVSDCDSVSYYQSGALIRKPPTHHNHTGLRPHTNT